ncbi:MAG: Uma2 family endonuclease [Trueperaceae bacterium]
MIPSRIFDTITVEEYLETEQDADVRHEYIYGEIYAMAGADVNHNIIAANISRHLGNAADKTDCRVYQSDMKVRVEEEVFYYPDVIVACQDIIDNYYENNPCVIVEILSKSTLRKDAMEKRLAYLALESLQLYLLVDSRKRWIKSYKRVGKKWEERIHQETDVINVPC